jgi:IS30 family transposase
MGCSTRTLQQVVDRHGGGAPRTRPRSTRHLSLVEREEISRGVSTQRSLRQIAAALGRAPSTIAREVRANGGRPRYRACAAEARAERQLRRPKRASVRYPRGCGRRSSAALTQDWSPHQIATWLKRSYPDTTRCGVGETISIGHCTSGPRRQPAA